MKKSFLKNLCLYLFILIFLFGCSKNNALTEQNKFNEYTLSLFIKEVQSNTINLNYTLSNPEKYGIKAKKASLGSYSVEGMSKSIVDTENYAKKLSKFNYNLLTLDQQLTYDILEQSFAKELAFNDFIYYDELLGPTTGIQAQLPLLLAEYKFYTKDDIDTYISLLSCISPYFKDIAQFEIQKAENDLFMSDDVANKIIEQCNAFTLNPKQNFLISHFDKKIDDFAGLTEEEVNNYKKANREAILNDVIPAYESLTETLSSLRGKGVNNKGLYYFPFGQEYYELLFYNKSGSRRHIKKVIQLLDEAILSTIADSQNIYLKNPNIFDSLMEFYDSTTKKPKETLDDLKSKIKKDFPELNDVNCSIKSVPKSLSEFLSPALFLTPPIDDYINNVIYINPAYPTGASYTTIAHEGYPGHLYQTVFFNNQNKAPIRYLLNYPGYSEGWASYAEIYSYGFADTSSDVSTFLRNENIISLLIYGRSDIGIHYEGWDLQKLSEYLSPFGLSEDHSKSVYQALLEEPGAYLPYSIGYLEFSLLKAKAQQELGNRFNAIQFHKFILETGPAPFDIIESRLKQWIKEQ